MKSIGLALLRGTLAQAKARDLDQLLEQVQRRLAPFAEAGLFTVHRVELTTNLGLPDDNRGYKDARFWEVLDPVRQSAGWDHIIGVTAAYLQVASFNRQNDDRTCGIISLSEWRPFVPPGLDLSDYLTYLVLCVATLQCAPLTFKEHRESEGCLFDLCEAREDLTPCLAKASARHCAARLEADVGWTSKQIALLERTLKGVRRRNLYLRATANGGEALPFLAGVGLSLAGSVVAGIVPRAGAIIAGGLIGASVWVALGIVISRRVIGRRKSRRVSTLLTAALPALTAIGVLIGATIDIPRTLTVRVDERPATTTVAPP